ncbi:NEP1-interacting protein-like 1 [Schistocerca americana]|uniref:NEP1-interacting protein-like 1 n=1 Tax=Schistocerca americana TaxID=7009 RepID=UPI001F4FB9C1|nr:NEP1-interacting protein-like 1 [Schistocerca americana]
MAYHGVKKRLKIRLGNLLISFMREYQDRLTWKEISINQNLSNDFVGEFQDEVDWNEIPKYQKLPYDILSTEQQRHKCAVCLDDEKMSQLVLASCKYVCRKECIDKWLIKQIICPLCRKVTKNEDNPRQIAIMGSTVVDA